MDTPTRHETAPNPAPRDADSRSPRRQQASSNRKNRLTQAVTKLISSYHIGANDEFRLIIAAYLDEIGEFDPDVVDAAVRKLVRSGRKFRPSVGELVSECVSRAEAMSLVNEHWEKRFNAAHVNWPGYDEDSDEAARRAFFALSSQERQAALARGDDFQRWCQATKQKVCRFSTYCRETRWTALPAGATSQPGQKQPDRRQAPPYGKLWSGQLLRLLCRPPQTPQREVIPRQDKAGLYRTMCEQIGVDRARQFYEGQGFTFDDTGGLIFPADYEVRARAALLRQFGWPDVNHMLAAARRGEPTMAMLALEPLVEGFRQVDTTSPMFAAWRAAFDRRNWPQFPDRLPGFVWLPAVEDSLNDMRSVEGALSAFEAALKAIEATPCTQPTGESEGMPK